MSTWGFGNGRGRPWRSTNNTPRRGGRTVCHHFQRGNCRYGASCKFEHVKPDEPNAADSSHGTPTSPSQEAHHDAYFSWKRLLRSRNQALSTTPATLISFWKGAIEILENGETREYSQALAKDLVDDNLNGLQFVAFTMERPFPTQLDQVIAAELFLKVITHPSILDCLSIEPFVATMYTFFGGANGGRAINFLHRICDAILAAQNEPASGDASTMAEKIKLLLKVLHELLNRDHRARFHDGLIPLLDSFEAMVTQNLAASPKVELDVLKGRLDVLKRIVDDASQRLRAPQDSASDGNHGITSTLPPSSFPREAEMPGGRHDNDVADIEDIKILPTLDEIASTQPEYLPSTNFLQPHVISNPTKRYIDTFFRLLRHDVLGDAKDALHELLKQDGWPNKDRIYPGDSRAQLYANSSIPHVFITDSGECQAILSFEAPARVRNMSKPDRVRWWTESSRLTEGSLICLLAAVGETKMPLFLVVAKRTVQRSERDAEKTSLVSDEFRSTVAVRLATFHQDEFKLLCRIYREKCLGILVEFQGLLPATFVPILKNLQRMQRGAHVAFERWILPGGPNCAEMPPPEYARKVGFRFSLSSITKLNEPLELDPNDIESVDLKRVEESTGLDHGQCVGLAAALSREYVLIQGPPGTGKSYLGVQLIRILLDAKSSANLGPILVICYTNHALDQFLKHLLDVGIQKIIRIGGRSQAAELEGKNLKVVSREMGKTSLEQHQVGMAYSALEDLSIDAGGRIAQLHRTSNGPSLSSLQDFLLRTHPRIHRQLEVMDEEGFQRVGPDPLSSWLGQKPRVPHNANMEPLNISELEIRASDDIAQLFKLERWRLAEHWMNEVSQEAEETLFEILVEASEQRQTKDNVHDEVDRRALTQADVIGMTTTALARKMEMIHHLRPKVILGEESGEVQEPHVISALMPSVQHFIQIGDHQQLRPQITKFSLSMESHSGERWQLDRSQFERRAKGEPGLSPAPVAQLNVQRRMRPEICRLIRRVYPQLQNHDSVLEYPDVVGMRSNLFWLDHRHEEESGDDGARKSHSNLWEVDMTTALVRHLVRQGEYSSTDIALLTPYTGQLRKLRSALSADFEIYIGDRDMETLAAEDVDDERPESEPTSSSSFAPKYIEKRQLLQTIRLATVDNFQGEEAKVIIVSLVRSNAARKVGFLRTENRINVLLSRAQHGMYLIGNSETYLPIPMWADVHGQLTRAGAVGPSFSLCCPRHPDDEIVCSEPQEFRTKSPEGGCSLRCNRRLDACGHKCEARCHSQAMHDAFSCCRPCQRLRSTCHHVCPKLCGEQCGPCRVEMTDVALPCGHIAPTLSCHRTLDLAKVNCEVLVDKTVSGCGHTVEVRCHEDVQRATFRCPQPCDHTLACGHVCPGTCGRCQGTGDGASVGHSKCRKVCDRPFTACSHRCRQLCHEGQGTGCGTCNQRCEVRCPHSACSSECNRPCAPCIEKCTWSCPHQGSCSMPCAAPCDKLPCDLRCSQSLECGHRCPGFCGETCPQGYCQECGDKADARVDLLEFTCYSEIDLDDSPIVVLGCGHFFTGETLDGLVCVDEVYSRNSKGEFDGLRDISASFATAVPSCPDCKQPIRQFSTKRYNRVINRAVMDEICKRFIVQGRNQTQELEKRLETLAKRLEDMPPSTLDTTVGPGASLRKRHKAGAMIVMVSKRLEKDLMDDQKPTKKLIDAIALGRVKDGVHQLAERLSQLKLSVPEQPDKQLSLQARSIQVRARAVLLQDTHAFMKRNGASFAALRPAAEYGIRKSAKSLVDDCASLCAEARDAKLGRLFVPGVLCLAQVYQLAASYRRDDIQGSGQEESPSTEEADTTVDLPRVRGLLAEAEQSCEKLRDDDGGLLRAVQDARRLFEGPRYETVTPEELASIKSAMVSGVRGIATHSGHWYNCVHGHPFAIGECGMPMEEARCPECGSPIGGQMHRLLDGNSRATNMES